MFTTNPGFRLWHHALAGLVIWGGLFVGYALVAGPGLVTYLRGTPATAHVDRCETHYERGGGRDHRLHRTTVCYGSWTINGVRHSGEIEGASETDEDTTIRVRATETHAAGSGTPRSALIMAGCAVVMGVAGHIAVFWIIRSVQRRMRPAHRPVPGPYRQITR